MAPSPSELSDLTTNQEEADTRMFLHAAHASRSRHECIAIKSSDTDVEILACFYSINVSSELFLESGTQARAWIIDVTKVCDSLGSATCLHALTGCDSVSSFAIKGKKKAICNKRQKESIWYCSRKPSFQRIC